MKDQYHKDINKLFYLFVEENFSEYVLTLHGNKDQIIFSSSLSQKRNFTYNTKEHWVDELEENSGLEFDLDIMQTFLNTLKNKLEKLNIYK